MEKGKRIVGKIAKCALVVGGVAMSAGNAMATGLIDVSAVDVDTTMVATLGLTVITGLAAMWGVRKVIKLVNRS